VNPHLAAVAALLHAAVPGLHVYVTEAERPDYDPTDWTATWTSAQKQAWSLPERWVVIAAPTPRKRDESLADARTDINDLWRVTVAANSLWKFDWLAERVSAAIDPGTPDVDGYSAHIELVANVIVDTDTDVTPHLFWSADTYRYEATPTV